MRSRLIYDRDQLITFREYPSEMLAALDQAVLAAADIPAMVQYARNGETRERIWLVIRHEHLDDVRELLDVVDGETPVTPHSPLR